MANNLLSVCMSVRNDAKFIRKALDNALKQECTFSYEIVLNDNASSDDTYGIICQYAEKYPDIFVIQRHATPVNIMTHFKSTWDACRGKYVAFLDAGDYWDDVLKLQKQVDFLEKHSDYVTTYHDCKVIDIDGHLVSDSFGHRRDYSAEEQMCGRVTMQLSTRMLRNIPIVLPSYMMNVPHPDSMWAHFTGYHGKAAFLDEVGKSLYRLPPKSNDPLTNMRDNIVTREAMIMHLGEKSELVKKVHQRIRDIYIERLYVKLRDEGLQTYLMVWRDAFSRKNVFIPGLFVRHAVDTLLKVGNWFFK